MKQSNRINQFPDLPLGLGVGMTKDPIAMSNYAKLSGQEQNDLIHYVKSATSGQEAKHRIENTLSALHDGTANFL